MGSGLKTINFKVLVVPLARLFVYFVYHKLIKQSSVKKFSITIFIGLAPGVEF